MRYPDGATASSDNFHFNNWDGMLSVKVILL